MPASRWTLTAAPDMSAFFITPFSTFKAEDSKGFMKRITASGGNDSRTGPVASVKGAGD